MAWCLGLAALLGLLGCGAEPTAVDTYTVRGVVRQLPSGPQGEILIRHEALPAFKNAEGEVVGMEAMAMPFPLAKPELAADLAVGDEVEMTFEVRWQGGGSPLRITALRRVDETP